MWLSNGDLRCDTCDQVFNNPGPRVALVDAARTKAWHVYRGRSLTGKDLDVALCPSCIGTNRTPRPKVETFDEEVPLF